MKLTILIELTERSTQGLLALDPEAIETIVESTVEDDPPKRTGRFCRIGLKSGETWMVSNSYKEIKEEIQKVNQFKDEYGGKLKWE